MEQTHEVHPDTNTELPVKVKEEGEKELILYEALYNPMTWESCHGTISIHLSKDGAEKAIAFHKMEKINEWRKLYPDKTDEPYKFGDFEDWQIREIKVLP